MRQTTTETQDSIAAAVALGLRADPAVISLCRDLDVEIDTVVAIRSCGDFTGLHRVQAAARQTPVRAVLLPGHYPHPLRADAGQVHLIGIGRPSLQSVGTHAVFALNGATIRVVGVSFYDFPQKGALACTVGAGSRLMLDCCAFRRFSDHAVLCTGGASVHVSKCVMDESPVVGIEVRDGGRCVVEDTRLTNLGQGVMCYGGFDACTVANCVIENCQKEGILAAGTATTGHIFPAFVDTTNTRKRAFWHPDDRANANVASYGTLDVTQSLIKGNKGLGISLEGVVVTIQSSVITGNALNGIHNIFYAGVLIKSRASVYMRNCAVYKNNRNNVYVAINFDAPVTVEQCFFLKGENGVAEEWKSLRKLGQAAQSLPVTLAGCRSFDAVADVPEARKIAAHDGARQPHPQLPRAAEFNYYYPIGNTPAAGLRVAGRGQEKVHILFGGCGDPRNYLETLEVLDGLKLESEVVLCDVSDEMLSRDLILLEMLAESSSDMEHVLSVYSDHYITEDCAVHLDDVLQSACDEQLLAARTADAATATRIAKVLNSWRDQLRLRQRAGEIEDVRRREVATHHAVAASHAESEAKKQTIEEYFANGFLGGGADQAQRTINVTFLSQAGAYTVYGTTSVFRAFPGCKTAGDFARVFARYRAVLQRHAGCGCRLLARDLTRLVREGGGLSFDYVDCSNLADYVAMPELLASLDPHCKPGAVVTMGTMRGAPQHAADLYQLGLKPDEWTELLGYTAAHERVSLKDHNFAFTKNAAEPREAITQGAQLVLSLKALRWLCRLDQGLGLHPRVSANLALDLFQGTAEAQRKLLESPSAALFLPQLRGCTGDGQFYKATLLFVESVSAVAFTERDVRPAMIQLSEGGKDGEAPQAVFDAFAWDAVSQEVVLKMLPSDKEKYGGLVATGVTKGRAWTRGVKLGSFAAVACGEGAEEQRPVRRCRVPSSAPVAVGCRRVFFDLEIPRDPAESYAASLDPPAAGGGCAVVLASAAGKTYRSAPSPVALKPDQAIAPVFFKRAGLAVCMVEPAAPGDLLHAKAR
ncbi:hypothetical protein DIPPA_32653 [Diplonema papillatum]|nr:hypothetical protein DIPPA_32653 [Diplonema papillatum]